MSARPVRQRPACRSDLTCGAVGDRTPDLMTASHALSQLSYGPVWGERVREPGTHQARRRVARRYSGALVGGGAAAEVCGGAAGRARGDRERCRPQKPLGAACRWPTERESARHAGHGTERRRGGSGGDLRIRGGGGTGSGRGGREPARVFPSGRLAMCSQAAGRGRVLDPDATSTTRVLRPVGAGFVRWLAERFRAGSGGRRCTLAARGMAVLAHGGPIHPPSIPAGQARCSAGGRSVDGKARAFERIVTWGAPH